MRILIFGAGAVGSSIGAKLHISGYDVNLVGRKEHIEKIKSEGLKVKGIWGEFIVKGLNAHTEIPKGKFDIVLITVKTFSNEEALKAIKSSGIDANLYISAQNGLGNYEFFSQHIKPVGNARVIFGVVFENPGEIKITVWGGPILLGFWEPIKDKSLVDLMIRLSESLNKSGLPSEFTEDIKTPIWQKALYNSALNPLSVIMNATYGQVIENNFSREIAREIIQEGISVAQREGAKINNDFFEYFEKKLVPPTKDHISSMIQDIKLRGKTEIDSMCGAIVKYGQKHKINTKVNFTLWKIIKAIEKQF